MRMQTMKWMAGTFVLVGILALSSASHASCTGDNRVDIPDASCLSGSHSNTCSFKVFGKCLSYQSSFWAEAKITCVQNGDKVVAKIDLKDRMDETWHLYNHDTNKGGADTYARGVYCCSDLGRCN